MYRLVQQCVLVLVALWPIPLEAVVGGGPANPPEPDAAVVFTQRHGFSSRLEGIKNDQLGYYCFRGIRYAEPPVGARRFQRPIRRLLTGEITATKNCLPCPQPNSKRPGHVIGQEDCLCLDIYTPKMPGEERGSPVVLYIHGGNYRTGSAAAYGGQHLTKEDTILVVVQYRLGSLGYLSTGQKDASGNVGLFDIHAAKSWVLEYIEFFGGDPNRLVIMGQGSGAGAASLMALSPEGREATGLAALSGTPLSPSTVRPDSAKHAKELATRTGCPDSPAERLIQCLKKLPVEKIVQADADIVTDMVDTEKFLEEISGRGGPGARVEGDDDKRALPPLVSEEPTDSLDKKQKRIPMLTGVTSAETSRIVFGKYSKFLKNKLTTVKDFIKNDLIGGLHKVLDGVQGLNPLRNEINKVIPLDTYYQALFDNSMNVIDGLSEIAEATGDALFNFPAYQSVKAWSTGGPAYLYRFEHLGNLSKGSHFLPGVALADDIEEKSLDNKLEGPAHGDELAYIFEPQDEAGNPIEVEVSSTDARVRNNFVSLIAQFARDLHPVDEKKSKLTLLPFSKGNEQFIKINEDISLDNNFRFCQMGLWGGLTERVKDTLCQNILGNLLNLSKLPLNPPEVPILSNVLAPKQNATNVPLIPNVLNPKTTKAPKQTTTKRPQLLPLGGFGLGRLV